MIAGWRQDPTDVEALAFRLTLEHRTPFDVSMMEDRGRERMPNTQFVTPDGLAACHGAFAALWLDTVVGEAA